MAKKRIINNVLDVTEIDKKLKGVLQQLEKINRKVIKYASSVLDNENTHWSEAINGLNYIHSVWTDNLNRWLTHHDYCFYGTMNGLTGLSADELKKRLKDGTPLPINFDLIKKFNEEQRKKEQ